MESVETRYGNIPVNGVVERFPDGTVKSCMPGGECGLTTPLGLMIPQHSTDDVRRRTVQALHFYANGCVRQLPLERPTHIRTPAGPMSAELVTFYENGALHRAFPLNGKLSGFWSETEEGKLARPSTISSPVGELRAKLISVNFAPGGELLSLTLWPKETLDVPTPVGILSARIGVSFRLDGSLRSLEPAKPQRIPTPAGPLMAFDSDAVGLCGDVNSLAFAPDGSVENVSTNLTGLEAASRDGKTLSLDPEIRVSICGEGESEVTPLHLKFAPGLISVQCRRDAEWLDLPLDRWDVHTRPFVPQFVHPLSRHACAD